MSWIIHRRLGSGATFHSMELPLNLRMAYRFELKRPTLVLGSAQDDSWICADAVASQKLDLVKRRSGGGMVLLVPGEFAWIDVTIGRSDPLWEDDISRSFDWLGALWRDAVAAAAPEETTPSLHDGPSRFVDEGRVVCHAGIGAGEVLVGPAKVVGLSQRRSRAGARFQCVIFSAFDPERVTELVAPHKRSSELVERLADGVAAVPRATDVANVVLSRLSAAVGDRP